MRNLDLSVLLVSLFCLASHCSAWDCDALEGAAKVRCKGKNFLKEAAAVQRMEPYLHPNPQFKEFQGFTLRNQRYFAKNRAELQRLFNPRPEHVRPEVFDELYTKYASRYTVILHALPEQLALHRSMFMSLEHDRFYMEDYDRALRAIPDDEVGGGSTFYPHECDYISQPVVTLWLTVSLVRLMDEYGEALWGDDWKARRETIHAQQRLIYPGTIRARLRMGEPYSPVEHLAPEIGAPSHDDLPGGVMGFSDPS